MVLNECNFPGIYFRQLSQQKLKVNYSHEKLPF